MYVLLSSHIVNKNITYDFIDRKNLDVDIKIRLICNAALKMKANHHSHGSHCIYAYLVA